MGGTASTAMRLVLMSGLALMPVSGPHAEIITPGRAFAIQEEREELMALVQRPDVARRLEVMGANRRLSSQRVAALSDREVKAMHDRLKNLPQRNPDETRLRAFAAALLLGTAFGSHR